MAVKQIQNAFDLIEYFARTRKTASLADIQNHFGWPRSSAYNILNTLVERGYLYEPVRRGGYYPTPRLASVAEAIVSADPLNERLAELLEKLSAETGETAILAAAAGRFSVYLNVIESPSPIRYAGHVGMRIPIHAGASGRALLALYSAAERASLLGKLDFEPYGKNALLSAKAVEEEIAKSLERGWFQSVEEYNADLAAIAIPVLAHERRLAIVVAGPEFRLKDQCNPVADRLRRITADFGFQDIWATPDLAVATG
ncbi:IclR family transcriptional regulator [Roseibium sp. RKSG952]|uniref:IclR family transcriptional regulator n=1 Tax=Roseibium sp. RKSG952 TaxID=2529384 RepID=UPI0012BCAC81|nr:IclR family transcriptional regulator [Roseibium sp. RKSG952]MTH96187.1 IclR family transcriptional regulator [Roseibium sp. RKSG952]